MRETFGSRCFVEIPHFSAMKVGSASRVAPVVCQVGFALGLRRVRLHTQETPHTAPHVARGGR